MTNIKIVRSKVKSAKVKPGVITRYKVSLTTI